MKRLTDKIDRASSIVILPHLNADGDAVGSSFAFAHALRRCGKVVTVVMEEPLLPIYSIIEGEYLVFDGKKKDYDLVIALDCSDLSRLGSRVDLFCGDTVCIDHHRTNESIAGLNYVEPEAAATGEIIYRFLKFFHNGDFLDRYCRECLYTAIATDTGCFRFSNTTPQTLRIAAELLEAGIGRDAINQVMFETVTFRKLRYQSEAVERMELYAEGKIAVTMLPYGRFYELGLSMSDVDGTSNLMLSVEGVQAGVFFHEREKGCYKVSMRSRETVDVAAVAKRFAGGGHIRASGCTVQGIYDTVRDELVAAIREQLG